VTKDRTEQPPVPGSRGPGRRRSKSALDEVFGDVLPDSTRDDRTDDEAGWAGNGDGREADAQARREAELRRDVPPHHG
jgi:hypothetical protein